MHVAPAMLSTPWGLVVQFETSVQKDHQSRVEEIYSVEEIAINSLPSIQDA